MPVIFAALALFISQPAFAQAAQQPSAMGSFVPLVLILVIFYLFVIRPQSRRMKQHEGMVAALRSGDVVVTAGGVVGKVISVDDRLAVLEVAEGVTIKIVKATVASLEKAGKNHGKGDVSKTVEDKAPAKEKKPAAKKKAPAKKAAAKK